MGDFAWLVPLIIGAALTFFFGWLDSTIRYRREKRDQDQHRARASIEQRRLEARGHAQRALELATKIRDQTRADDERHPGSPADWDKVSTRELSDIGVLIPDPVVRAAITDATNLVTAGSMAAHGCEWEWTPREIQLRAMVTLRSILGSYLRVEDPDPAAVEWITRLAEGLAAAWAEQDRLERESMEQYRAGE